LYAQPPKILFRCKTAPKIYHFQRLFFTEHPQINIKEQYDNNFSWSNSTLFTGKFSSQFYTTLQKAAEALGITLEQLAY